jgi:predicted MFS family arabinose efflux permease
MNIKTILSSYSGFSSVTWKLVGAGFMNAMGMVLVVYISLYMNSINFSVKQIGILLSVYGIAGLIGGYLGGILADHFPAIKICKVSLFFNAFPLVLFPVSQSYFYLLSICFLLGLASNTFRPAYILALTQGEKPMDMERIIALRRVAINLGAAFGAALFGFIAIINFTLVFLLML